MFRHKLGVEVETKVAKLKGVVISRSENLYGCNRYFVQPKVGRDMKVPDGYWVDEDDIVVKSKSIIAVQKDTGGPMSKIM